MAMYIMDIDGNVIKEIVTNNITTLDEAIEFVGEFINMDSDDYSLPEVLIDGEEYYYADLEYTSYDGKSYQYDHCDNDMISIATIEKALLDYFDADEIDDSGCNYNGKWFSLQTVMNAITKAL